MVSYEELLDFKNQKIVDEVYHRVKMQDDAPQLEEAYHKITQRNQTKGQSALLLYDNVKTKVSQILSVIAMLIFVVLFIVGGSLLLSFVGLLLNYTFEDALSGLFQWMYTWGMSVYDVLFASSAGIRAAQIVAEDAYMYNVFYVLGLTTCLVIIFTGLFISTFFRKNHQEKKEKELSLDDAYHYLQTNEDDTWHFIQLQFQKRVTKRKNRDFFELYYRSYILLFHHFQEVEGTIKDLDQKEQVKLIFFTIVNTLKNVLGAWVYPLYFSLIWLIVYYQNFYGYGYLESFISVLPLGKSLLKLINGCYSVVMHFSMFAVFQRFDLEAAKVLSFLICLSVVMFVYSLIKTRIPECLRQYHRRLNYYLKKKQGLYDEQKKYSKCYLYSVQFFFFMILVCFSIFMGMNNPNELVVAFVGVEQEDQMKSDINTRYSINEHMKQYAKEHHSQLKTTSPLFSADYIFVDELYEDETKRTYLKVYTYYNQEEAQEALQAFKILENHQLKTDKEKDIQYYYSEDGFVLRQGSVVVIMKNSDELNDSLFAFLQVKEEVLTKEEIRQLIQTIGYDI